MLKQTFNSLFSEVCRNFCHRIWRLLKAGLFQRRTILLEVGKNLSHLWSAIYVWVMLSSYREWRVSFLKIPAMTSGSCQSHHVFIIGRNHHCDSKKEKKRQTGAVWRVIHRLPRNCVPFLKARDMKNRWRDLSLYIQWYTWLCDIDWEDGSTVLFLKHYLNVPVVN